MWSSKLFLLALSFGLSKAATFEAETGVLTGLTVSTAVAGYSGTGYVVGFDDGADNVAVTVTAPSYAVYVLTIRYRAPYGEKKTNLLLNGVGAGEVTLLATDVFSNAPAGKVLLNQGANVITLQNNWGWYEIDSLTIELAPTPPAHKVNTSLVNTKSISQAKNLYTYFVKYIYGKKIVSGQQELEYIKWIEDNVGKTPAIAGLDFMDYSPSRVERGTVSHAVEDAISWDLRDGIVSILWHWNAPSGLIDVPGQEWWRGFYTSAVTFDIAATLANKNGTDYQLIIRDIDAIAVQLKRLQAKKIPVLWRPLHESGSGGWFWWSAKGPGPVKELYRILYNRLVTYHKINNLIWVWNSPEPAYYPGDDIVDILSYDSYPAQGDHGPVSAVYDQVLAIGQDKKIVALGEVGTIPDPDLLDVYKVDWAWFITWNGEFITDGKSNSLDFLKKLYNHKRVITLDEVKRSW